MPKFRPTNNPTLGSARKWNGRRKKQVKSYPKKYDASKNQQKQEMAHPDTDGNIWADVLQEHLQHTDSKDPNRNQVVQDEHQFIAKEVIRFINAETPLAGVVDGYLTFRTRTTAVGKRRGELDMQNKALAAAWRIDQETSPLHQIMKQRVLSDQIAGLVEVRENLKDANETEKSKVVLLLNLLSRLKWAKLPEDHKQGFLRKKELWEKYNHILMKARNLQNLELLMVEVEELLERLSYAMGLKVMTMEAEEHGNPSPLPISTAITAL